nr:unnamed protein product [Callosobruchus analis]
MIEPENQAQKGSGSGFVWVETQSAVFYSCYFAPNAELAVFESELSELRGVALAKRKESIWVVILTLNPPSGEGSMKTGGEK